MYFQEKKENVNYNKIQCICCSSLLCPDNWTPVYRIHHILNEIKQHNVLKISIMYFL